MTFLKELDGAVPMKLYKVLTVLPWLVCYKRLNIHGRKKKLKFCPLSSHA